MLKIWMLQSTKDTNGRHGKLRHREKSELQREFDASVKAEMNSLFWWHLLPPGVYQMSAPCSSIGLRIHEMAQLSFHRSLSLDICPHQVAQYTCVTSLKFSFLAP